MDTHLNELARLEVEGTPIVNEVKEALGIISPCVYFVEDMDDSELDLFVSATSFEQALEMWAEYYEREPEEAETFPLRIWQIPSPTSPAPFDWSVMLKQEFNT